jgi:WhiB family redox-sensing transcriptional regulator
MGAPVFVRSLEWITATPVFPDALCASPAVDPDWWFPSTIKTVWETDEARALCGACRHRVACLEYAISADIDDGIFGGLDPVQRNQLKRRRA